MSHLQRVSTCAGVRDALWDARTSSMSSVANERTSSLRRHTSYASRFRRRRARAVVVPRSSLGDAVQRAVEGFMGGLAGDRRDVTAHGARSSSSTFAVVDGVATWDALAEKSLGGGFVKPPGEADARANVRLFDEAPGTTPRVKLYRDSASWCPYSQKIWMQLEEKRVPYVLERINMRCYGAKPKSFLEKVPSGALPVIELDGQVITESSVIAGVLEEQFPDHKNLLPYAPESVNMRRAQMLMRLERALFSRWMQWITSGWNDSVAQSAYCETLDSVDAELGAMGGPFFMGSEFTMVDIAYTPFLERMAGSILYYKGLKIEGNGGRWPNLDKWFAAMANRDVYRGIKSDYYTTAHDLPPQLGGCVENGENAQARDAIDGVNGIDWKLPLGPLDATSLEPWWGEDDPRAARLEAASRVIDNHVNVTRFAARGCGQQGSPAYSAPLSDPNAKPGEEFVPAVDAALRVVVQSMLQSELTMNAPVKSTLVTKGSDFPTGPAIASLAYLRDRIGVPRDMSYPAARQFRAHLNYVIDSLAAI